MPDRIDREAFGHMTAAADATSVDIFGKEYDDTAGVHLGLAAAGMIPAVGNIADVLDAALYGLEGDKLGVGLSLLSAIPGYGLAAGAMKLKKGSKITSKIAKGTEAFYKKFGPEVTEETIEQVLATTAKFEKEGKIVDKLLSKGINIDDAIDLMSYKSSLDPSFAKSGKALTEMGYSEAELFGKEAVKDMMESVARGEEFLKNNPHLLEALGIRF